jgi:hypothetical protein
MDQANPQNLVLAVHALNALSAPIEDTLRAKLVERIASLAPQMDPQQVAMSTAVLVHWCKTPPDVLMHRISDLASQLSPKGLCMALEGVAASCSDTQFVALKILSEIVIKIDEFDAKGCALVLNSIAKLNLPELSTAEAYEAAILKFNKVPFPTLREAALVTNAAVRRLDFNHAASIIGRAKSFSGKLDVQSAALLLNATAKCGIVDETLVRKLIGFPDTPSSSQRAIILHALGKIGISEFREFALSLATEMEISELRGREFFMTLYGLGRLRLINAANGGSYLEHLKRLLTGGSMDVETSLFLYRKYLRPAGVTCGDLEAMCIERQSEYRQQL